MKGFLIFLVIVGVIGGGGYYAYTEGHLDSFLPKKDDGAPTTASQGKSGTTQEATKTTAAPAKTTAKAKAKTAPTPKPAAPTPPPAPKTELERKLEAKYPMPNFKSLVSIVDNWNQVPERAFPPYIIVNEETEYTMYRADGSKIGSSKAEPGHKAKVLKFKPGKLLVTNSSSGDSKAAVDLDKTDFKARVQTFYDTKVAEARERVLKARRIGKQVMEAQAASGGSANLLAGGGNTSNDNRFAPVKAYLKSGKLKSGLLEEATEFYWLGSERHGGTTYDVALVNFEVKTMFGTFPNSMKCLMSRGKVEKWVDAETGEVRD